MYYCIYFYILYVLTRLVIFIVDNKYNISSKDLWLVNPDRMIIMYPRNETSLLSGNLFL